MAKKILLTKALKRAENQVSWGSKQSKQPGKFNFIRQPPSLTAQQQLVYVLCSRFERCAVCVFVERVNLILVYVVAWSYQKIFKTLPVFHTYIHTYLLRSQELSWDNVFVSGAKQFPLFRLHQLLAFIRI